MNARKKDPRVYLDDIQAAIMLVAEFVAEGREEFSASLKTQNAVIRLLIVIGEAAAKLPRTFRDLHPEVPWKKVVGMRNVMIHDYSNIDIPTIWIVAVRDLPELKKAIELMIGEWSM